MMHRRTLLLGSAATLAGCAISPDRNHDDADAPWAAPLRRPVRTAWVLSSGGPRGFTHVGVLKALEELGLAPDLIVGASVGAMVGSLCASGMPASEVERIALELQPTGLARVALGQDENLNGGPIAELVRQRARVPQLEQMPRAMACVATRRSDRNTIAFTAGDAGLAVQASAAIEGRFTPVRIRGEQYVDPDWYAPLPVRIARALGAQRVLAVDATVHLDSAPDAAERFRAMDLRKKALIDADAAFADLVLKPDFGYWVNLSTEFRQRAIEAGYRATLAQAPALRRLHSV
jgi:NTE family protein